MEDGVEGYDKWEMVFEGYEEWEMVLKGRKSGRWC